MSRYNLINKAKLALCAGVFMGMGSMSAYGADLQANASSLEDTLKASVLTGAVAPAITADET